MVGDKKIAGGGKSKPKKREGERGRMRTCGVKYLEHAYLCIYFDLFSRIEQIEKDNN